VRSPAMPNEARKSGVKRRVFMGRLIGVPEAEPYLLIQ
jgi:hypothetical protein